MTKEQAFQLLQDTAERLGEHFDAVEILACHRDRGYSRGSGNWFARRGMVAEWMENNRAQAHADAIAEATPPEDME